MQHDEKDVENESVATSGGDIPVIKTEKGWGQDVESRWHQCPRCSFWFDCLIEPSFTNRPEECPPDVNKETIPVGQQSITDNKQESDVVGIAQFVSTNVENDSLGIQPDRHRTSKVVVKSEADDSRLSKQPEEASDLPVENWSSAIPVSQNTQNAQQPWANIENGIKQESGNLPNTGEKETEGTNFEHSMTGFSTNQPLLSKLINGVKLPERTAELGHFVLNLLKPKVSKAKKDGKSQSKSRKRKIVGKSQVEINQNRTKIKIKLKNYGLNNNKRKNKLHATALPQETKSKKRQAQVKDKKSSSARNNSGPVEKTKKLQVKSPNQKVDKSGWKLKSIRNDVAVNFKEVYYINGIRVQENKMKEYQKAWKQCDACGKILIPTKLHLFNYHKDLEGGEVKFHILNDEQEEQNKTRAGESRSEPPQYGGKRPPKQCTICKEWVVNLPRHMTNHVNKTSFSCSKCQRVYRFKESLDNHVCSRGQYSNPERCSLCGKWYVVLNVKSESTRKPGNLKGRCKVHCGTSPQFA